MRGVSAGAVHADPVELDLRGGDHVLAEADGSASELADRTFGIADQLQRSVLITAGTGGVGGGAQGLGQYGALRLGGQAGGLHRADRVESDSLRGLGRPSWRRTTPKAREDIASASGESARRAAAMARSAVKRLAGCWPILFREWVARS
jgi:hypothetical protein